ncbi:hypothetical protein DPMN_035086 [Dreissena polymorpha]|uniref:G-protein coupled receptors family 1 profile domain-containing protein n=1 Tax=Dreissena polymorpha TaxID=45954 RepID=A0A9D4MB88_DREPO|nr:hypothetical protein DPMN_035086 [Dreissena polymorpha]
MNESSGLNSTLAGKVLVLSKNKRGLDDGFQSHEVLQRIYYWYFYVIAVVLVIPTVCGNSLILISLARFSRLRRQKALLLIGNLAVADLFVGLVALPMEIVSLTSDRYSRSPQFCFWEVCVIYTNICASVVNLFLLSLERFDAILYPFQHHVRFTKRRLYIAMASLWIIIVSFGLSPIIAKLPNVDKENFECYVSKVLYRGFIIAFHAVIILCLVASTIFFLVIAQIARKAIRRFQNVETSIDHQRMRREIRHTRNMLIVSGMFIVFWGPYCFVSLIPDSVSGGGLRMAKDWLSTLGLINSCLNWIVYGIRCSSFRSAFKSIVTCDCTGKKFKLPFSLT